MDKKPSPDLHIQGVTIDKYPEAAELLNNAEPRQKTMLVIEALIEKHRRNKKKEKKS